jgi:Flp pilus assembly protein TadG
MAMVEMVITLPLLLMLLFAVAEFGVIFARWQTLTNAAREGARTAVVFRAPCSAAAVDTEVRQVVRDYAASAGITLADGDIGVLGTCGGLDSDSVVDVSHTYTFTVLPRLAASLSPDIDLDTSATMRNEGNG